MNGDVAVVIPTLNAGEHFARTLSGIRAQRGATVSELVVMDCASTDGTAETARRSGATVVEVDPSRFNHGLTRLAGIGRTCADLVVLMTQDAVLEDPDVFAQMARHFDDGRVAGVCVRQAPREDLDEIANRRWARLNRQTREVAVQEAPAAGYNSLPPAGKMQLCAFDNVCSMLRRSAVEEHPLKEVAFAEDRLWARDVIRAGWRIVYDGRLAVVHSHAPGLRERLARAYVNHRAMHRFFGYCFVSNPVALGAYVAKGAYGAAVESLACGASPGRALVEASKEVAAAFAALAGLMAGMQEGPLK